MIYVMRHGESNVNVERKIKCKLRDGDLTENGRLQAQQAADWLADKKIDRIYASPFDRAQQTAQVIGDHLGLDINTLDGLAENDCGGFEGRTDMDAWKAWGRIFDRWLNGEWEARFPEGESYREAYDRFLGALMTAKPDENTLMVTHGGITRAVVPYLCVNAAALQRVLSTGYTGFILLEPYDLGRFECVAWGLEEHLL